MSHYGTHLREAFCGWLEAGCPPEATVEVDYEPQTWETERLLRRMLNCSVVMPGSLYDEVVACYGLDSRQQTYGSIARALLDGPWRPNAPSAPRSSLAQRSRTAVSCLERPIARPYRPSSLLRPSGDRPQ